MFNLFKKTNTKDNNIRREYDMDPFLKFFDKQEEKRKDILSKYNLTYNKIVVKTLELNEDYITNFLNDLYSIGYNIIESTTYNDNNKVYIIYTLSLPMQSNLL